MFSVLMATYKKQKLHFSDKIINKEVLKDFVATDNQFDTVMIMINTGFHYKEGLRITRYRKRLNSAAACYYF